MAQPVWDKINGWIDPETGEQVPGGPGAAPSPPGRSLSTWNNPFTHSSGVPLDSATPAPMPAWMRWLNPGGRAAIAGGGILASTPAETGELPLSLSGARPEHPHSTGRMPYRAPDAPIDPYGLTRTRAPDAPIDPFSNPRPAPSATPPAPPAAPAAAAPSAVAAQRPNLGYYTFDRPNMPAGQQGGRGGPSQTQMGMFGFDPRGSFLGLGGPPAAAPPQGALAARPDLAQRVPLANAPMPPVMPGDVRNARVRNAVSTPNWWQNLGGST